MPTIRVGKLLISTGAYLICGLWAYCQLRGLDINPGDETALDAALNGGTSVTLTTSATGAPTGGFGTPVTSGTTAGDINVNTDIAWTNAAASLTLSAYHGIAVNNTITGAGGLNLTAATGPISINAATRADTGVVANTAAGAITVGAAVNSAATVAMHAIGGNLAIGAGGTIGRHRRHARHQRPLRFGARLFGGDRDDRPLVDLFDQPDAGYVTSLKGNVAKTYDGTTAAALALGNVNTSGLVNGDVLSALALSGTYASANAATGISVTSAASPTSFGVTTAGGLAAYGYQFTAGARSAAIGTINPLQLIGTIVGNPAKVYDGTTTATLNSSNYSFNELPSQPGLHGRRALASPDQPHGQCRHQPRSATSCAPRERDRGRPPASSTPAPLNILNLLAIDKVYDGATSDALNTTNAALSGVINSDNVTLDAAGATGNFASPNLVGNGSRGVVTALAITAAIPSMRRQCRDARRAGAALIGAGDRGAIGDRRFRRRDARRVARRPAPQPARRQQSWQRPQRQLAGGGAGLGNRAAMAPNAPRAQTSTPKPLAARRAARCLAMNARAMILGSRREMHADRTPDAIALTFGGSRFMGHSIGTRLSATRDPAAARRRLATPAPRGDRTPTIVNNPTKTFDGTNTATLTQANLALSGAIGNEQITVDNGSYPGTYATANAGTQNVTATLTAGNLTFGNGAIASNYILPLEFNGLGTIVPAALGISASINGATKVYDGTTGIAALAAAPGVDLPMPPAATAAGVRARARAFRRWHGPDSAVSPARGTARATIARCAASAIAHFAAPRARVSRARASRRSRHRQRTSQRGRARNSIQPVAGIRRVANSRHRASAPSATTTRPMSARASATRARGGDAARARGTLRATGRAGRGLRGAARGDTRRAGARHASRARRGLHDATARDTRASAHPAARGAGRRSSGDARWPSWARAGGWAGAVTGPRWSGGIGGIGE
ncbi:MAG: hypothetical protein WDW36_001842 [Sanguina aurantia]